jgi:predicted O-methyltransferase YrrM
MDQAVAAVLAEYEVRAQAEEKLWDNGRPTGNVDDLLLPVGPVTGRFLNELAKAMQARSLLEVGTSYGYSTLWLAEAARETGGQLTTLELQPAKSEHARAQLARAGLAGSVQLLVGDALETLGTLSGPFDFVLIDLWKDLYIPVFDLVYPRLAPEAAVIADNMIRPDTVRHLARAYRKHVRAAPDMSSVLLPLGSGIEVSRFKAP